MNPMTAWGADPLVQRLGWTLVNFVWQGTVVALLYAFVRAILGRRSVKWRYGAGCVALATMAALPLVTFVQWGDRTGGWTATLPTASGWLPLAGEVSSAGSPGSQTGVGTALMVPESVETSLAAALSWIVLVWLIGLSLSSLRLAGGWWLVRRCCSQDLRPVEPDTLKRLERLRGRLQIRQPVRLFRSAQVQVPTVMGWLRPVILLPGSCLFGLTTAQIDLLLAHELAHIRRHDYWVNGFQVLIEAVLFYHPAIWWVSRCVREDREYCCDELAVSVCGDRLAYAEALAAMEALRSLPHPLALGAASGSLLARVRHILGLANPTVACWRQASGALLLLVGLFCLASSARILLLTPTAYVATSRVAVSQFRPWSQSLPDDLTLSRFLSRQGYDPFFLQTEMEKIGSPTVLREVALKLNLELRDGRLVQSSTGIHDARRRVAVANHLRQHLRLRQLRNTSLIDIRMMAGDPHRAADIANAIADVYMEVRNGVLAESQERGLALLTRQHEQQQRVVKDFQDRLDQLRRDLGVPDAVEGSDSLVEAYDLGVLRKLDADRQQAQAQRKVWSAKLQDLKAMPDDERARSLLTINYDQPLAALMMDKASNEQRMFIAQSEFAEDHPERRKLIELNSMIRSQIMERINGILAGMNTQARVLEGTARQLSEAIESHRHDALDRANRLRPYFELKRNLESESRILETLRFKLLQAQVDIRFETSSQTNGSRLVECVDRAEPPLRPQVPNRPRGWFVLLAGLLSSGLGSWLWFIDRRTAFSRA
jgi:beta-lactamase regulating signal transducer with metallopeptidase domain